MAGLDAELIGTEWTSPFPVVYFDNAGRSHQPKSVEQAGVEAIKLKSNPWQGLPGSSSSDVLQLRSLFSSLVNGGSEDNIALFPSTAFAMSMIASNVLSNGLINRDNCILVLQKEMGSVIYPWQNICNKIGCTLRVVPIPDWTDPHASWTKNILDALDDFVAVLSLPHVHWCDGSLIDLSVISKELSSRFPENNCGSRRPLLIVDATQSIGALPLDVTAIKADAVACSVHKWLLSPYGTSLVYIHPKYHETWLPLDHHERAREGSEQAAWDEEIFMDGNGFYPSEFFAGARRLDAGGRPNPVWIPAIHSALKLIDCISVPVIHQHLSNYCDALVSKLMLFPNYSQYFVVAPRHQRGGHFFGLCFHNLKLLQAVHTTLKEHNIFTSIRGHCMRISPYLSNTTGDANLFQAMFYQALRLHIPHFYPALSGRQCVRVLVTGACGWLAQVVFRRLLSDGLNIDDKVELEIFGTMRANNENNRKIPQWLLNPRRVSMDLTSDESVSSVIESVRPDIVLHLAALSSPLECHKNPELARKINSPAHLIEAIQRVNLQTLFIFASTDMVYDGEHPPYATNKEEAEPRAVNVYGATKREMEKLVSQLPYGVSLRLSNMVGCPYVYEQVGEKFLQFLSQQLQQRNIVGLKEDEVRSFVYVEDVVTIMRLLMQRWHAAKYSETNGPFLPTSVLNVGGPKPFSRMGLAQLMCDLSHIQLEITNDRNEAETLWSERKQTSDCLHSWVVYRFPTTAPPTENATERQVIISSAPRSPRNIAMDSSDTEKILHFHFSNLQDIIEHCLYVN